MQTKQQARADLDTVIRLGLGKMTQRDMADMVGVSVATVSRRVKQLGLGAEPVQVPKLSSQAVDGDRLSRLEELRDMLYEAMQQTSGGSLANLSKEYRATLAEIEAEGSVDGEDEDDPIAAIVASLRPEDG